MLKQRLKNKTNNAFEQLLRYAVSGGAAFAVDFCLLWLLAKKTGMNYLLANAIGFSVGLIITYTFSIFWVFSVRRLANAKVEFLIFVVIGCVGLLLNSLCIWLFTKLFSIDYLLLSKLLTTAIVTFWNFFAKKFLLFSKNS